MDSKWKIRVAGGESGDPRYRNRISHSRRDAYECVHVIVETGDVTEKRGEEEGRGEGGLNICARTFTVVVQGDRSGR